VAVFHEQIIQRLGEKILVGAVLRQTDHLKLLPDGQLKMPGNSVRLLCGSWRAVLERLAPTLWAAAAAAEGR